jgi:L-arabinose transport system substrate-binding protein
MRRLLGRRRISVAIAAAALAAALTLAACGSSDSSSSASGSETSSSSGSEGGEAPLLVTINKLGTTSYMLDLGEGFKEEAKNVGAQSRVVDVELDSAATITELQNAITSGAAGIAITVPDQTLGPRVSAIAEQAGVPLVATNDTIEDQNGEPVPFIGFDNAKMGKLVGESAAEQLNEEGWVEEGKDVGVLSVEVQTLSVCQDRNIAANKVMLEEVPGLEKSDILHVPFDGSTESALKAAPGFITSHPEVENWVVYACDDEGVAGSVRALEQAGVKTSNVIGVGLGAATACEEWDAGRTQTFRSALWLDGADVGDAAVKELYAAATEGKPLPKNVIAPVEMVTPETYKQAGVHC